MADSTREAALEGAADRLRTNLGISREAGETVATIQRHLLVWGRRERDEAERDFIREIECLRESEPDAQKWAHLGYALRTLNELRRRCVQEGK